MGKTLMVDPNKGALHADKVDLIYSVNTITPLFVRKAFFELEKKNTDGAISILTKGLKHYPNFAAAYLSLGKAFALRGDYIEAIDNIKKGSDLIPSKKTYDFYLNEIENIKDRIFLSHPDKIVVKKAEAEITETEKKDELEPKPLPKDDKLEELVKEVAPETKPSPVVSDQKPSGKNIIVSETLAKIYASQGEYKEAIDIYNLLKEKHPDKVDFYSSRIKELEEKLNP
jgi:tetratricopeptide (TPR) repeat protein